MTFYHKWIRQWIRIPVIIVCCALVLSSDTHPVRADFKNLVPCNQSAPFQKRLKNSIKKLETRLKLYDADTKPAKALNSEIAATKSRFARYANQDKVLCGKDGLPHLIASGQWDRANEFILPGIVFIYITGWIGWVGRKYLQVVSLRKDPAQSEIIIDVPTALPIMNSGFLWPIEALQEFANDELLASEKDITVSPR